MNHDFSVKSKNFSLLQVLEVSFYVFLHDLSELSFVSSMRFRMMLLLFKYRFQWLQYNLFKKFIPFPLNCLVCLSIQLYLKSQFRVSLLQNGISDNSSVPFCVILLCTNYYCYKNMTALNPLCDLKTISNTYGSQELLH